MASLTQQFSAATHYLQKLEKQAKPADQGLSELQAKIDTKRHHIAELRERTCHCEKEQAGSSHSSAGRCRP